MIILFITLAMVLCLICVLAINTAVATKKARKLKEFKPFYSDKEIEYYAQN